MYGRTSDFQYQHYERWHRRVLMANLLQKLFVRSGIYVTIDDADIGSLKSLHTLFEKYFDHMLAEFERNRMVRTIQNFVLCDKKKKKKTKKWLTIFDSVDATLKDVSVTETIV